MSPSRPTRTEASATFSCRVGGRFKASPRAEARGQPAERALSSELDGGPETKIELAAVIEGTEDLAGESSRCMETGERPSMRMPQVAARSNYIPATDAAVSRNEEWIETETVHVDVAHGRFLSERLRWAFHLRIKVHRLLSER